MKSSEKLDDIKGRIDSLMKSGPLTKEQETELLKVQVLADIATTLRFIKSNMRGYE